MKEMTVKFSDFEDTNLTLGERLSELARMNEPGSAAKWLAAMTGASLTTTKGWLVDGKSPQDKHLRRLARNCGRNVVLALFAPEIDDHEAELDRKIAATEAALAQLKAGKAAQDRL